MKSQEANFYEKYWQAEQSEAIFQDTPIWGNIEDLKKLNFFFKEAIKGKVLDTGCGLGDWVFNLAESKQVISVTGVDISDTAIKKCNESVKDKQINKKVKFITSSLTELPFKRKTFDNIFSIAVIEHVLDVDNAFAEFNRVMKKRGYLGITTVDFNFLKKIIIGLFFFEKYFDPRSPHIRFFTKETLGTLLKGNGFELKKHCWQGSYFGIMPMAQMVLAQKVKDI